MTLEEYIQELSSMRCSKAHELLAPHKPVLMLAIIKLIESGQLFVNRIEPNDRLQKAFQETWNIFVGEDSPFRCDFSMPFFHMKSEPFWFLVRSDEYDEKPEYSISALRKSFKWAELDEILFEYLFNPYCRQRIKEALISFYFGNKEEKTKIEKSKESMIVAQASHKAYFDILNARGLRHIHNPIWKMKITDEEYSEIKKALSTAEREGRLERFRGEAAIFYAEWWRREYSGGVPSKEDVAASAGIEDAQSLYLAARDALTEMKVKFISTQRVEYFRTMLSQGGIPVNHIKSGSNFSSFKAFLGSLVKELSSINFDWNSGDSNIVSQLNCVSYLGRSFQNENIYDLSLQIAHAIIFEDDSLLPYDCDDQALIGLTNALKKDYQRSKAEHKTRPFSISWKLTLEDNDEGVLWYAFDPVKEIGSDSLPGLSPDNCFSFDVIVCEKVVAKYSRSKVDTDPETGVITRAIYSRINLGLGNLIRWRKEQAVDVKVRCDDGKRLFVTLPGSYPPDFSTPQTFQQIENNIYSKGQTANRENNVAVFTTNWTCPGVKRITICGQDFHYVKYSQDVDILDSISGEHILLKNSFTQYAVEYADTYIDWIESSNFKLCTHAPRIRVYDSEKNPVSKFGCFFRSFGSKDWHRLQNNTYLPEGPTQFKVIFPDGHFDIESFYCINKLGFSSTSQSFRTANITCDNASWAKVEAEENESVRITKCGEKLWHIEREEGSSLYASTCAFRIFKAGVPTLRLEIPLPFVGVSIVSTDGQAISNKKTISYYNLYNFRIVSHGMPGLTAQICFYSGKTGISSHTISLSVPEGITPLSDFSDAIDRMFNCYILDSFSRLDSVKITIADNTFFIRKFVLESDIDESGRITVLDRTEGKEAVGWVYKGRLFASPLSDEFLPTANDYYEMVRESDDSNCFLFPEDFPTKRAIVFSDIADTRRIVPKLFKRGSLNLTLEERNANRSLSLENAREALMSQDIFTGQEWYKSFQAYRIASRFAIPFKTFTSLWVISSSPKLMAQFILGMWYSGNADILVQDISTFEQEFVIGVHWIRPSVWSEVIGGYFDYIFNHLTELAPTLSERFNTDFMEYFRNVYSVTIGPESASEFLKIVSQGTIAGQAPFMNSEMNEIKSKVIGASDDNRDLPRTELALHGHYYQPSSMKYYYTMMLHSPMTVAEHLCDVPGALDIWSDNNIDQRRVINYYRQYFKNAYSMILIRTLGIIAKQ